MDFTAITIEILKGLAQLVGNYGLAIIVLTIIVRLILWPLSVSQQRSMRKMQTLSPKLKEIQNRYKNDPQTMQRKMMEFYKEHQFNPFGGCLPLLLQLPIFILLYQALISPMFIQTAGDSSFLFIKRLDATLRSHSGKPHDGIFGVNPGDTFSTSNTAKVFLKDGKITNIKFNNPGKAIEVQGDLTPGEPVDFKIQLDNLKAKFSELDKIEKAQVEVINNGTKEIETLNFERNNNLLTAQAKTEKSETIFHYDVLLLVLLFGLTMYLSQKVMMATNSQSALDANQQAMQQTMANIMPIMITATFVFFPIPAGVLLYLIASNIIQIAQTVIINKQLDFEEGHKNQKVLEEKANEAKTIKAKKINDSK